MTVLEQRSDRHFVQLDNGMLVLAQRLGTAPVVSAQVWVKTGSIFEQEHVGAGLSHFLEHLASGGTTTTRSEAASNAQLGQMGARTNAATSLDTVRYYIDTTAEHENQAIALLSDWMQNATIPQDEYAREREVIQREFAMGRGEPGRIFWKLTQQARYQHHPARHPTIGYLDEFMAISRDEIADFYQRMYVPNNMVFVVVGDIDPARTVIEVATQWADAEPGSLPEVELPVEAEIVEPITVSATAAIRQPRLRLAWPGTRLAGEGDYALDLLAGVLGKGESSRLKQTVRDDMGLVTSIDAYNLSFAWGEGFFAVDAQLAGAD
ncbi:MAG: pitrilysin family protein, partial [Phycisphaeraceae bacterium]|nr:pitrilysin family protein [Phycisphaeraceae bacterium]